MAEKVLTYFMDGPLSNLILPWMPQKLISLPEFLKGSEKLRFGQTEVWTNRDLYIQSSKNFVLENGHYYIFLFIVRSRGVHRYAWL